ncbi:AbrB family transcriptional regulator [Actinophytocola sp.]|uniref:AbrB family transcriptional regulator n=1 Tax=Actinophytocola sp. TaxID=1872138 RepID=UPI0025C09EED|nr:AbrB family transcriptional regulator [Actinophytocola sp.]
MTSHGERARWLLAAELAAAAAVGGALFAVTGQGIIWVLGGVLGGVVACRVARASKAPAAPSAKIRKTGQLLIGAAIGPGIASQRLEASFGQLGLLAAGVLGILVASLVVARMYSSLGPVDGLTAGMATLPGGIGVMPSVAAEYGKPVGLVAIVQSVRMTLVLVMALVVFGLSGEQGAIHTAHKTLLPMNWLYVTGLLAGSLLAWWVAAKLRIPVPSLLGPLLFGCFLSLGLRAAGVAPELLAAPFLQEIIGQALLGITVGEYLAQRYKDGVAELLGGIAGVVATCAVALLIALGMATVSPWSFLTSLLMVAPGGAPEMVVIAAATGGELTLVLAAQTGRQVIVNILMPVWIRLFTRFDRPGRS